MNLDFLSMCVGGFLAFLAEIIGDGVCFLFKKKKRTGGSFRESYEDNKRGEDEQL